MKNRYEIKVSAGLPPVHAPAGTMATKKFYRLSQLNGHYYLLADSDKADDTHLMTIDQTTLDYYAKKKQLQAPPYTGWTFMFIALVDALWMAGSLIGFDQMGLNLFSSAGLILNAGLTLFIPLAITLLHYGFQLLKTQYDYGSFPSKNQREAAFQQSQYLFLKLFFGIIGWSVAYYAVLAPLHFTGKSITFASLFQWATFGLAAAVGLLEAIAVAAIFYAMEIRKAKTPQERAEALDKALKLGFLLFILGAAWQIMSMIPTVLKHSHELTNLHVTITLAVTGIFAVVFLGLYIYNRLDPSHNVGRGMTISGGKRFDDHRGEGKGVSGANAEQSRRPMRPTGKPSSTSHNPSSSMKPGSHSS
ncbi:MAG TPA: hypothetical protein VJB02_06600 [Coxiellaceae bacterium]|nr:hypothetical protein [Coxiellaceae bacterium]